MVVEVLRVRPDDAEMLKTVRLAALKDSPSAFGSTYAEEKSRTDEQWGGRALTGSTGVDRVTFFAVDNGHAVGLVGGYRPDPSVPAVELVSMWTSPGTRRSGVGRSLVEAVLAWAADAGASSVGLWVTRGNEPAYRLYAAMGFRETDEVQPLPSGPGKDEVRMTLVL